jgi:hypothetical protein
MSTAFVCHSHHRVTASSRFVLDALRALDRVEVFWDDAWRTGVPLALDPVRDHARVVVHQVEEPALRLARCGHPDVTFIPMFDSCHAKPDSYWRALRGVKVVSFSATLHARLRRLGVGGRLIRFYPDPARLPAIDPTPGLRAYLWQRTPEVTWETALSLLGRAHLEHLTLHAAPDPGVDPALPAPADRARHGIRVTRWYADRTEALDDLARHNVYFAPRLREGIGLSFLEAMAMGLLVVAPARPTMSEYITPGVNGLLYEPGAPRALDLARRAALGGRARDDAAEGFAAFGRQWPEILEFIAAPPRRPRAGAGRRTLQAAKEWTRRLLRARREGSASADARG